MNNDAELEPNLDGDSKFEKMLPYLERCQCHIWNHNATFWIIWLCIAMSYQHYAHVIQISTTYPVFGPKKALELLCDFVVAWWSQWHIEYAYRDSVANTTAKPRNWATFDPVLTTKNRCAAVWRNISYTYLYGLWSGAAVWEVIAPRFGKMFVGNTVQGLVRQDVCNLTFNCSLMNVLRALLWFCQSSLPRIFISSSRSHSQTWKITRKYRQFFIKVWTNSHSTSHMWHDQGE